MAHYGYTAARKDGEVYSGVTDAESRFQVYEVIRREGGHLLNIDEEGGHRYFSLKFWNERLSTVKEYDKVLFARNAGAMLSAGLSLARVLSILERQTKSPRLTRVIEEVSSGVRHGETFHDSLNKFPGVFPRLFVAMVRAGEEGGQLPQSLSVIADQMERMLMLKKKIRGALIYPSIIVIAIVGIGYLMMTQVVPTLAKTFGEMGAQLPLSTQVVIAISDFLVGHTIYALALLLAFAAGIFALMRSERGKHGFDFIIIHLPVIGDMVREVNAARTARALSSLLSSGVDMIEALSVASEVVQNSYFRNVILAASDGVAQGETLSAAFMRHEDLYPSFVGEMMAVGEETGQLSEMMKRVSQYYEDEVDRKTKDLSTIIEPILMLFIGGAVGFFAVAMITPIYSLSSTIN